MARQSPRSQVSDSDNPIKVHKVVAWLGMVTLLPETGRHKISRDKIPAKLSGLKGGPDCPLKVPYSGNILACA